MADGAIDRDPTLLSPDDAFAVLGNDTRMGILQALAEADRPLAFSELRDRVGLRDSGQFNYHLDKLVGHFVARIDDGYDLRPAGRRVISAVLSGALTDQPVLEPTPIDDPCPICGGPTLIGYAGGRVRHYCTACPGYYGHVTPPTATTSDGSDETPTYGNLGSFRLPPAGVPGRSPQELFRVATTWGLLNLFAVASDACPHCSAPIEKAPRVCDAHETDATAGAEGSDAGGYCERCENRHAIQLEFHCTNCRYGGEAAFAIALMADVEVLSFLASHGINPVSPSDPTAYSAALLNYEEGVRSVEPFEARFEFALDDATLTLVVDDDLAVHTIRTDDPGAE